MNKITFVVLKRIMTYSLIIILILVAIVVLYMQQAKFGKAPTGARLLRMQQSPNYRDGQFQNILHTPTFAEGYTIRSELYKQLFGKFPGRYPEKPLPSVKTDLRQLAPEEDVLIWFGHSSYFIQTSGKKILVDPVFSGNVSPIPGTVKAFAGTEVYTVADLPDIDYLLISHGHYDDLDYGPSMALKDKTKLVICGLGVGAHFERWGYAPEKIIEKDWYENVKLDSSLTLHTTPARHKSGRGFKQNNTLWLSFVLQTPTLRIFIGGDSGYGDHFKKIGATYGPFELAILENGQYDSAWHYIHTLPEETLLAAKDLQAKRLLPVHSGKFTLARHRWNEPLETLTELNKQSGKIQLVTPMIGEPVRRRDSTQHFTQWWKTI